MNSQWKALLWCVSIDWWWSGDQLLELVMTWPRRHHCHHNHALTAANGAKMLQKCCETRTDSFSQNTFSILPLDDVMLLLKILILCVALVRGYL